MLNSFNDNDVVFDGDPDSFEALLKADGRFTLYRSGTYMFDRSIAVAAARSPNCWKELIVLCGIPVKAPRATLFLHRMILDQKEVLIAVDLYHPFDRHFEIVVSIVSPAGIFHRLVARVQTFTTAAPELSILSWADGLTHNVRFCGGRSNPAAANEFLIPFVLDKQKANLHGYIDAKYNVRLAIDGEESLRTQIERGLRR